MDNIKWIEEWHRENAFDDGYALKIEIGTTDNPGWFIKIDLSETRFSELKMKRIIVDNSNYDWLDCRIENEIFIGYGDCLKLNIMIDIFRGLIETM